MVDSTVIRTHHQGAGAKGHIGDQPVGVVPAAIHVHADIGARLLATGFERLGHESPGLGIVWHSPRLGPLDKVQAALREDSALGLVLKGLVLDQVQPQKRSEDAERVVLQRLGPERTESGRMNRPTRLGLIAIADRINPMTENSRRMVCSS
jgi:hypothetical protein